MADLMAELKLAMVDLVQKKKVYEAAAKVAQEASANYESSVLTVHALRSSLDKSLNEQLVAAGVTLPDSRVSQSE